MNGADRVELRPRATPRPLADLLPGQAEIRGSLAGIEVDGITHDSRAVRPGDLWVALGGLTTHGARFAADAMGRGAVAVLTDAAGAELLASVAGAGEGEAAAPVVVVDDPRAAMGPVAAALYGHPADHLLTVAVTGTNGKTTTTWLVAAALARAGHRVAVIGTNGYFLDSVPLAEVSTGAGRSTVTTPESVELHALLAVMVERGATALVMEVSSHAMVMQRTAGLVFDVAGFTNLGRDHLDFHPTMADYFAAKASLFTAAHCRFAVVLADGEWSERLVEQVRAAGDVELSVVRPSEADAVPVLALPGAHNRLNLALALGIVAACGLRASDVADAWATVRVPGRLERVPLPGAGAPQVWVDFAHTPQAITSALTALADALAPTGGPRTGSLVCVVGCGGDRDAAKREPMGAAAAEVADVVVITDDNPRGEDPATIRAAALTGARAARRAAVAAQDAGETSAHVARLVRDGGARREALALALALAGPSDAVAVLGKGHETGQEVAGVVHPFDDRVVVSEEWQRASEADR